MGFSVDFAEEALEDLANLWTYYSRVFDEELAQRRVDEVVARVQELCVFPESGALHHGRRLGVRKVSVRQHLVFYLIAAPRVQVLRVLHVRRGDLETEI